MINTHAAKVQENAGRPYQRKESLLRGISGGEEGDDRVQKCEAERGSAFGDHTFTGEIQRKRIRIYK